MVTGRGRRRDAAESRSRESGSVLVMAVFVIFLVTNLGIALMFLSRNEVRLSQADTRSKAVFYIAEAGLEDARRTLFWTNGEGEFEDDLLAAAGVDGAISFDLASLQPSFDGDGNLTGFSGGVGDDVPVTALTGFGDGNYLAYLTNDPAEGRTNLTDEDDRVMLTGIGTGPDRSIEVVQAIIQPRRPFPLTPQAAITILGPTPNFFGGHSDPSVFEGSDCGVPGATPFPTVGVVGSAEESLAETGIWVDPDTGDGPDFQAGAYSGEQTIVDLTNATDPLLIDAGMGTLPPEWQDCLNMKGTLEAMRGEATHTSMPSSPAYGDVIFIDGDFELDNSNDGQGILVVTGELTIRGTADWDGMILAIGEGNILRDGGGNGVLSGAIIVADVAGPDEVYGNADDCQSGFEQGDYYVNGNGNADVQFCSTATFASNPVNRYKVDQFIQR